MAEKNKVEYYYKRDKNNYVTFKDGRKKEKLRKFIADAARKLKYLDDTKKITEHRGRLIVAYEAGGVEMLVTFFISELERITKAIKEQKETVIKSIKPNQKR